MKLAYAIVALDVALIVYIVLASLLH